MEIVIAVVLFVLGILLIVKGGDLFVDAASWIAEVSGIPKFIIGATVVSIATTMPELLVSAIAAWEGKIDMAVGNAVGSVTANVGLIMGISVVCIPSVMRRSKIAFKSLLMIAAAGLLWLLCSRGELSVVSCFIMLGVFVIFVIENVMDAKSSMDMTGEKPSPANITHFKREKPDRKTIFINAGKFVLGAAGIILGAQLLVDNGSILARVLGVPESIIGVTIIAVGTSLPELVTTITAITKKQASLSIGNIIGANIIDLTMILPVCGLISGGSLPVSAQSYHIDIPVCFAVILLGILPVLISERFHRWQGVAMLALYAGYIGFLCMTIL